MRKIELLKTPFPHIICTNYFEENQLISIWEELKFLTKDTKLFVPGIHHGAGGLGGYTSSRALCLEEAYRIHEISNILQIYKGILTDENIQAASLIWPSYLRFAYITQVTTKVRYYHNGDKYDAHTDWHQDFLLFSYFHTEPKKFTGGEVYFPEYDYTFNCDNNSIIIFPGYVEHEVKTICTTDDYWNGNSRYCISQFLSITQISPFSHIKNV